MSRDEPRAYQPVIDYFESLESRFVYSVVLRGVQHFGYFPDPHARLSQRKAQEAMHELLADRLRLAADDHVLDAGCGQGRVAVYLARRYGCRVTGITVVPKEVDSSRRWAKRAKVEDRVAFHQMDYTQTAFPDASFDAVFTMEALVHAYDLRRTLGEFRRVLKPGGRLALFEYSIASDDQIKDVISTLPDHIQRLRGRFGDPDDWIIERAALLSARELRHGHLPGMLREAGFIDVREEDISRNVEPSLLRLRGTLRVGYPLARLFRAHNRFVNTTTAMEAFPRVVSSGLFHYNITTAARPNG